MKWTSSERKRFFIVYGPTETTVCATMYEYFHKRVDNELSKYINQGLPIGKAIDGVKVFVLGEDLQ
jgi:non-ribosomal peptide synthetase component F